MSPSVGDMIAEGNIKKINSVFYVMLITANAITVFSLAGIINYIDEFIILWLGKDFLLSNITLILFFINSYINTIISIFAIYNAAKGLFRNDVAFVYLQAITNLVMSILLVNFYGINGVLMGTLIGNVVGLIFPKIRITYKYILLSNPKVLLPYFIKFIIMIMIHIPLSVWMKSLIDTYISISNFFDFSLSIIVYTTFSALLLSLLALLFSEFRTFLMKTMRRLIK